MGTSHDAGAVADPAGRVHGVEGVSFVDASVMPNVPSPNTHLPVSCLRSTRQCACGPPPMHSLAG